MNILLFGTATENSANARLLRQSEHNINRIYTCGGTLDQSGASLELPVQKTASVSQIVKAACDARIDLVILTTEHAIQCGLANAFQSVRIPCFGPTTVAAHFRSDPKFLERVANELAIQIVSRTVYHSLNELSAAIDQHKGPHDVVIRAVRDDGKSQEFTCSSLPQMADAVYILESQSACYQSFYIETLASGSHCTFAALVNDRNIMAVGKGSDIKTQVTERVARPLLKLLRDDGTVYTGWLSLDLVINKNQVYLCDVHCLPRPTYLHGLSAGHGFDYLRSILSLFATEQANLRTLSSIPALSGAGTLLLQR